MSDDPGVTLDTVTNTAIFVVPAGIDDPDRPSGGNVYDRRICRGLAELGWDVSVRGVPGRWPEVEATSKELLAKEISAVPDGAVVLLDGLIASASAGVLVPAAARLRMVVLVHIPLGVDDRSAAVTLGEGEMLRAAVAVVVTSFWARDRLLQLHSLPSNLVIVAEPGVDPAELSNATSAGTQMLCVAVVAPHKGQDVLIAALGRLEELDWRCAFVGALDRDPVFVDRLRDSAGEFGIADRIRFVGPLTGDELDAAYARADLLLLASHAETYAMVVTEALAHGIPVIAADVGGLAASLGHGSGRRRPGVLVPAGDVGAFAGAVRNWLTEPEQRRNLRVAAVQRRELLTDWSVTSEVIARVLTAAGK